YPEGSLISDGTFLYGMTAYGGINDMGVIFKIKSDGTGYSRLLNFAGAANGRQPWGSLISDGTFLYGMTFYGGTYDVGTVFKYQYYVNGIAENNAGAGFNVYPNPGSGKFLISSNRDISSIEIYNSMGKKVFQSKNPHKEIDISNQTKGIYFIKIYDGQTVLAKKIVIQ
ncbi:MAG: T9SS type A sorting domain-containing protein, partial [Bacteroidales bacterium]